MRLSAELKAVSRRIGHDFSDPDLLVTALTHPSMSGSGRIDNQRLEFLGDRVLGLIMAEALLNADEGASEGVLAPTLQCTGPARDMRRCGPPDRPRVRAAPRPVGGDDAAAGGSRRCSPTRWRR